MSDASGTRRGTGRRRKRREKRVVFGVGWSLIKFFTQKFVALVSLEFLVARLDEKSTKVASCFRRARHGIALRNANSPQLMLTEDN